MTIFLSGMLLLCCGWVWWLQDDLRDARRDVSRWKKEFERAQREQMSMAEEVMHLRGYASDYNINDPNALY